MCHEAAAVAAAVVGYVRGCTAARLQHGGTDAPKDATRAGQSLKMLREEEFSRRQQSSKQHKGFFNSSLFPPLQAERAAPARRPVRRSR